MRLEKCIIFLNFIKYISIFWRNVGGDVGSGRKCVSCVSVIAGSFSIPGCGNGEDTCSVISVSVHFAGHDEKDLKHCCLCHGSLNCKKIRSSFLSSLTSSRWIYVHLRRKSSLSVGKWTPREALEARARDQVVAKSNHYAANRAAGVHTAFNGSPGKDRSGRNAQAGDYDAAITMINGNNTGGRSGPRSWLSSKVGGETLGNFFKVFPHLGERFHKNLKIKLPKTISSNLQ